MSKSPAPSSPGQFAMSSVPASTAASSPPPSEDPGIEKSEAVSSRQLSEALLLDDDDEFRGRLGRLERILDKSFTYSKLLGEQMDKEKRTSALRAAMVIAKPKSTNASSTRKRGTYQRAARKRPRLSDELEHDDKDANESSAVKEEVKPDANDASAPRPKFLQPSLITGATLKDYQLDGVEWMVSLDKNGVSGILADEMGLGKTLQTIAFNAHLRELGHFRPFLIVCPLSVVHNWIEEFRRFAPSIPVCMYHGSPTDRAELRRTVMREPDDGSETAAPALEAVMVKEKPKPRQPKRKGKKATKTNVCAAPRHSMSTRKRKVESDEDDDDDDDYEDEEGDQESEDEKSPRVRNTKSKHDTKNKNTRSLPVQTRATFPVVVTTYEMIIRDRPHLSKYNWGYIVVDEGHRLKNLNCKLIQEIKRYPSAGRMILTGTPLQNNLSELWSLLNFILPDIFDDLDAFQEWFNLGTLQSRLSPSQATQLISTIHGILKPFLLRRLKADVLGKSLPPKKEYVIYCPLSVEQRGLYDAIVEGSLRHLLLSRGGGEHDGGKKIQVDVNAPRKLRANRKSEVARYDVDGSDDDEYFETLDKEGAEQPSEPEKAKDDLAELGRQHRLRQSIKGINNLRLQNSVMQLRKACSHPLLFDAGLTEAELYTGTATAEELVDCSGKMMVLERLLDELFARGHKVLLFSQFTTLLDIIETWATELKGWNICRIDGKTDPLERREQMNTFQQGGSRPDAPRLFLLSTRAGGLGINLTAADTVIFYDQDWNPQMDIQAQDRAHRIGQTKPVLIFRLVTAHTVEERIMHRASEKRQLEALVIAKGKFKMPGQAGRTKAEVLGEMAATLLKLESEHIEVVPATREGKRGVLSDEDLDMLLDRNEAVFLDRGKGWSAGGGVVVARDNADTASNNPALGGEGDGKDSAGATAAAQAVGKRAAFAVYEAPVNQANEWVTKLMGEDVPE
ncbi:SNF2 family DNA-dependent ATPase [Pisolithus sp. B1]|nr:SNF2 family DNA-dependent ATPase [Pisolithus sp. B1]